MNVRTTSVNPVILPGAGAQNRMEAFSAQESSVTKSAILGNAKVDAHTEGLVARAEGMIARAERCEQMGKKEQAAGMLKVAAELLKNAASGCEGNAELAAKLRRLATGQERHAGELLGEEPGRG